MKNVLVVVVAVIYFVEVPEEVLVKMTNGNPEKGLKNQFLGVYMTSEKTGRKCKIWEVLSKMWKRYERVGVGWTSWESDIIWSCEGVLIISEISVNFLGVMQTSEKIEIFKLFGKNLEHYIN